MRAVTFNKKIEFDSNYADPKPAAGECLVKVHMAGLCSTDLEITRGYMAFSGVLGHEFVGTVVEGSEQWKGKRVAAEINCVCGKCRMCQTGLALHCAKRTVIGIKGRDGCLADYMAIPEHNLHQVPDSIDDEQAVFIEPLAAAYQVLSQRPMDERSSATIVGSGRLGLLVAQVLATTGCKLTVVGRNRKKLSLCEKKGIQGIHIDDLVPKQDHELVVDCTGSPEGLKIALSLVRPRGTIILKSTYAKAEPIDLSPIVINEIDILGSRCGPFGEAINALAREAIDVRSLISKTFPIEKGVEALEAAADSQNVKILLKINPR